MTDADTIESLKAEIANLRADLGTSMESTEIMRFRHTFGLTSQQARVLIALFNAKGRILSVAALDEALPAVIGERQGMDGVKGHICAIRRKLKSAAIYSLRGLGYAITQDGLIEVRARLEAI